ncbi:hypothetical protein FT643_12455 [Ketobacter sp. MCCC 1A13808]|uniref:hypothetical protein n=1 Tax=Ketobacter sp. MCCC 1A13808 TaxID=2602738 RepID=UPI0012EC624E|nr:hypothetical protein [Ketobacter sp. MCCC 1A13808]MVF12951.1 hypothetical protein [Ketobacter sp. MCCC 1A13808]
MKKLMIFTAAATLSTFAMAGDVEKIDTDFDSLDNNDDMHISQEEADDNNISHYFSEIDSNEDKVLSLEEYRDYIVSHPSSVEEGEELPES